MGATGSALRELVSALICLSDCVHYARVQGMENITVLQRLRFLQLLADEITHCSQLFEGDRDKASAWLSLVSVCLSVILQIYGIQILSSCFLLYFLHVSLLSVPP